MSEIAGEMASQRMFLGIAALMTLPLLMAPLSLRLQQEVARWTNIGAATFLAIFNSVGLPSHPSAYDRFLIVLGPGVNALTIWYAWQC